MLYQSTRGNSQPVSAAGAIKLGIAPDGGLFVPDRPVYVTAGELALMAGMTYQERAASILQLFLTDFTSGEIRECVQGAYDREKFDVPEIAPLQKLDEHLYVLELWHGPTCAFKDMALQILPRLLPRAVKKTGEDREIAILVATSGDTGKAALEGFRDVPGTHIIVFFPARGVSEVQRLQMITQEGRNVHVVAVEGNFDQTQSGVKAIFTDSAVNAAVDRRGYRFSSANSINWGRLVPQIVYYFSAYADLLAKGEIASGETVNFVVPTGNFGNILAAFYARQMGLPVKRLICAANRNNVLTDFIRTGTYDRTREFYRTISPSMDILISSNLERLLYEVTGGDAARVREWMGALQTAGRYQVDGETLEKIQAVFWSDFAGDPATMETIRNTYRQYGYLMDTHTAVGKYVYDRYVEATRDTSKTVIASTASPFKFNQSVATAILGEEAVRGKGEFELLETLSRATGLPIPKGLKDLDKKPVRHTLTVAPEEMKRVVQELLTGRN
ncbi:threonine synthase [Desulfofundulus thermosubterraneus]|uniref:Threonine synthase n=1 Tax=Desulfofundulus thermosubterraneus DSM 16057 TaxID=1121432 RepID=A0A1M6ALV0_9FIRM|nr:threonine synthase [Desulfofundulus thermosubterraneus]SHI37193.1 threonine synthase [Desulfofundulus thermosubterraneus DSM 16057]